MGDFVKGPIPDHLPPKIIEGLRLHRQIDSLAHNSLHTRQSRQQLHPKYGHGRSIVVDIFYDHFLAANWSLFATVSLEDYAATVYQLLRREHANLPEGLQQIVPRMIEYNWLVSYRHHDVVGKALERIAQRLSRPLPLHEATQDLKLCHDLFFEDFKGFMDEAKDFARRRLGC